MRYRMLMLFVATLLSACCAADEPELPLPEDTLAAIDLDGVKARLKQQKVSLTVSLTEPLVALGRQLFFDPILSEDNSVSCATCHRPASGFTAPDAVAVGIRRQKGARNTPTILNRAFGKSQFWDGRADSLEEQSLKPIANPLEMGSSVDTAVDRLRSSEQYPALFAAAFNSKSNGAAVTEARLGQALAAFERTLLTAPSVVDRFQDGDYSALTTEQRQGLWIFESRGKCWKCHSGDNYSDESFHNIGVSFAQQDPDPGRSRVTGKESDLRRFRTPTLRQLTLTAPYMHDGSLKTLKDVVEFYNRGGSQEDSQLDPRISPLGLSDAEVSQLVAFLKALSKQADSRTAATEESKVPTPGQ